MKTKKEYLKQLMKTAVRKFQEFEYPKLDLIAAEISYIPTKKRSYLGIKAGLDGLAEMKTYKVKETSKIRSDCKFYQKLYKTDGNLVKIDSFIGGHDRLADSYIAYYENNYRYLFPFDKEKKAVGIYIVVTRFENGRVAEEFMCDETQIIYESYRYADDDKVNYYYINYVPTGSEPVLGESSGYYKTDTLEYVQEEYYVWYQEQA